MAKTKPARAAEKWRTRVRYTTRNGRTIIPALLIRFVANNSQISRGKPPRPRHGLRRDRANENGHVALWENTRKPILLLPAFPISDKPTIAKHKSASDNKPEIRAASRARVFFTCIALAAAGASCHSERAPVEELYTTRMVGLSYLQRNQLPDAESAFKKL